MTETENVGPNASIQRKKMATDNGSGYLYPRAREATS